MRNSWILRVASWIAAALIGGVFGLAGTIGHSMTVGVIPVGMIVGAIACGSLLLAFRLLTHDRAATLAAGLGMIAMVTIISGKGPGGSVIVQASLAGNIWIYLVAGLVLITVAWPSISRLPVATEAPEAVPAPLDGALGVENSPLSHRASPVRGESTARES